jgi:hypothetical protein
MDLVEYQRAVVDLLFREDFATPLATLGGDERRWRVYRRMARARLRDALEGSFPRTFQIVEAGRVIDRWLDASPPRSPYLRALAGEFVAWLGPDVLPAGTPPWLLDLARLEWARLEVSFAHEEEAARDVHAVGELSFDRPAVLTPAHRLARAAYAVHRLPDEIDAAHPVEQGDFTLCLYRDPSTHEARVLELSPIAAAILEQVAPGEQTVVDAVRAASARAAFAIDGPFVAAFAELVADLHERGVWLGSR